MPCYVSECAIGRGGDTHPRPPPAGSARVVSDWRAARNIGAKQCTLWSLVSALTVFQVMGADVVPSVGAEDGARRAVSSSRPNKGHTPSFFTTPARQWRRSLRSSAAPARERSTATSSPAAVQPPTRCYWAAPRRRLGDSWGTAAAGVRRKPWVQLRPWLHDSTPTSRRGNNGWHRRGALVGATLPTGSGC